MSNSLILKVCGSGTVHNAIDPLGVYNALYTFPSGDHAIPVVEMDNITVPFISEFLYTTLDCFEATDVNEDGLTYGLYPNPAKDVLNVVVSEPIIDVQITNMLGKRFSLNIYNGMIDVSFLSSGVYCLELKTKNKIFTEKFFKK